MDRNLLEKYFNNSCNNDELNAVMEWFKKSAKTQEGKELLFRLWEEMPEKEEELDTNFDHILDKIHHDVNLLQSQDLLSIAQENISKFRKKERIIMFLSKAAAIFLIPLLLFSIYISYKYHSSIQIKNNSSKAYNEVLSSVDAITKVTLPDGSNVWLNHSSALKFPATFEGDSRTVELKGEGYFEVAHNPEIPFIVKVGEICVVARGTTFNVLAYPEEDRIETSLVKGKVDVQEQGPDGQMIALISMKPKDLAIYQKNDKKISVRTINDDRNFAWKDGKLIFNKAPMGDVAKKLSRWFNVEIQITDPKVLELNYTATFKNETLPQVMELLSMVSPISYSISSRKEIEEGNFTKRKVILRFKNK